MTPEQARLAKLMATQVLRIQQCMTEIAQVDEQLADIDWCVSLGHATLVSREMVERMRSEPVARLAGLHDELNSLRIAGGQ